MNRGVEDELADALGDAWSQLEVAARDCVTMSTRRKHQVRGHLKERISSLRDDLDVIRNGADDPAHFGRTADPDSALAELLRLEVSLEDAKIESQTVVGFQKLYNLHFHGGANNQTFLVDADVADAGAFAIASFPAVAVAGERLAVQRRAWTALRDLRDASDVWRATRCDRDFCAGAAHSLLEGAVEAASATRRGLLPHTAEDDDDAAEEERETPALSMLEDVSKKARLELDAAKLLTDVHFPGPHAATTWRGLADFVTPLEYAEPARRKSLRRGSGKTSDRYGQLPKTVFFFAGSSRRAWTPKKSRRWRTPASSFGSATS